MKRALLFAILLVPLHSTWGQDYSGPKCLGPLCLDGKVAMQDSVKILGPYASSPCCFYRSKRRDVFLTVHSRETSDQLGTLALATSPEGGARYLDGYAATQQDLGAWKTPEGIALGSSEEEVLKAYGKPSREENFTFQRQGVRLPEKGLVYKGRLGADILAALFGIRNGKIISIRLDRSSYAGPDCLGPFCLGNTLKPANVVLQELGFPPSAKQPLTLGFPYCYQSPNGKSFARLDFSHESPPEPWTLFLSDFPTCMHVPTGFKSVAAMDLSDLKTPEGIGLGSSLEDVLRIYGKPASQRKFKPWEFKVIFFGYKEGEKVPDIGDTAIDYSNGGALVSEFGIRNGRVSYVELSASE